MSAVFTPLNSEPIGQILTAEEYDALPESRWRELVDGVIRMMAAPNARHQYIAGKLFNQLDERGRPRFRAIEGVELRLGEDLRRIPDVMVVRREVYDGDRNQYEPHEVVLAVEVVSRGSESADRREKPFEYARAGISYYWRVEPKPRVTVHAYRLASDRYRPAGQFAVGETVLVEGLEWAAIPVADLED
jgi:Uma2 family endonuclease